MDKVEVSNTALWVPFQLFLKASLYYYLFWLIVFVFGRVFFLSYHTEKLDGLGFILIANSFLEGLSMDISATTYIFCAPLLLMISNFWIDSGNILFKAIRWYTYAILLTVCTLIFADAEIYANWGAKISSEAISYLSHPKEALASSQSSPLFILIVGIILSFWSLKVLYIHYVEPQFKKLTQSHGFPYYFSTVVFTVCVIGIAIILIRGGIGLAPMGAGNAYHSKYPVLNHAATNTSWNFIYSIQKSESERPCEYDLLSEEIPDSISTFTRQWNSLSDTIRIFKNKLPNIVLIVLEGWPNEVVGSFGGEQHITPFFDRLTAEGLAFTNIYSSGDRTYKGVPAVLSAYPALSAGSIIQYIQKMESLPCLASTFEREGYDSYFIYGGDIEFKSLSSYITHCGFDQIKSQDDFPEHLAESKWGVHDHHVFQKAAIDFDLLNEPFFSTILTLSSHEPYDVPIPTQFPGSDEANQFRNSVYYADWSIQQFFEEIKEKPWFDNTIFVFTSDHGKPLPHDRESWEPEAFNIPFLIYGNPISLKYRGLSIVKTGSQLDLATTLLHQLDIPSDDFRWSRDLFHPNQLPFAMYSFETGLGAVYENQSVQYDRISNKLMMLEESELSEGQQYALIQLKAIMQEICFEFESL